MAGRAFLQQRQHGLPASEGGLEILFLQRHEGVDGAGLNVGRILGDDGLQQLISPGLLSRHHQGLGIGHRHHGLLGREGVGTLQRLAGHLGVIAIQGQAPQQQPATIVVRFLFQPGAQPQGEVQQILLGHLGVPLHQDAVAELPQPAAGILPAAHFLPGAELGVEADAHRREHQYPGDPDQTLAATGALLHVGDVVQQAALQLHQRLRILRQDALFTLLANLQQALAIELLVEGRAADALPALAAPERHDQRQACQHQQGGTQYPEWGHGFSSSLSRAESRACSSALRAPSGCCAVTGAWRRLRTTTVTAPMTMTSRGPSQRIRVEAIRGGS